MTAFLIRRRLDRTVTVRPMAAPTTPDRYGNRTRQAGEDVTGVPAGREPMGESEVLGGREETIRRFVYYFEPGEQVTAFDRIIDGGDVFEVRGPARLVETRRGRRARPHHLEANVEQVEG